MTIIERLTDTTRITLLLAMLEFSQNMATAATDGTWINANGGSWATPGNWSGNSIADGPDATASFVMDITAGTTITLDGPRTIGNLIFNDTTPNNNWVLNTGSGDPLTLGVSSGSSTITINNQTVTIGTVLAGNGSIVKNGPGTLFLSAVNTFTGPLTINGGWVRINARGGSYGSCYNNTLTTNTAVSVYNATLETTYGYYGVDWINIAGLTLAGGATVRGYQAVAVDNGDTGIKPMITVIGTNTIYSQGGNYTKNTYLPGGMSGDASAQINYNNGAGYRDIILNGGVWSNYFGTVNVGNDLALNANIDLLNAKVTNNAGAIKPWNHNLLIQFGELSGAGTLNAGGYTNIEWRIGNLGTTSTYSGVINGAGKLTKVGAGTLTLTGANTFSNDLSICAGNLSLGADNTLTTDVNVCLNGGNLAANAYTNNLGPLTVNSNSTIYCGSGNLTFLDSTGQAWNGNLTIVSENAGKSIRVGTNSTSLTVNQLRKIKYGPGTPKLDPKGYLIYAGGTVMCIR